MSGSAQQCRLFLTGDLMLARGIDQIMPHPGNPRLYEPWVKDARDYVQLAERRNGPVPRPVEFDYVWGVALGALSQRQPDLRLVNLETAVTRRGKPQLKGIHYRMHPANLPVLMSTGIDACSLANNHVLDWSETGLADTLHHLGIQGLRHAGAGRDLRSAEAPAILALPGERRLLLFAFATGDCGVPPEWAARDDRPGVARLDDLSMHSVQRITRCIAARKRPGDRVVLSLHWGGNWDFAVSAEQRRFAHALIDNAGVDVLHGHSSHHIKGIEVYRERLILYGCGDLLNDYEGIEGHATYRGELGLLYFADLDNEGRLLALELLPTRLRRLRLEWAEGEDRRWVQDTLERECARLGCSLHNSGDRGFTLDWPIP